VGLRPKIAHCPSVVPLDKRLGEAQARGWAVVGFPSVTHLIYYRGGQQRLAFIRMKNDWKQVSAFEP
jgi:hypothetical protein